MFNSGLRRKMVFVIVHHLSSIMFIFMTFLYLLYLNRSCSKFITSVQSYINRRMLRNNVPQILIQTNTFCYNFEYFHHRLFTPVHIGKYELEKGYFFKHAFENKGIDVINFVQSKKNRKKSVPIISKPIPNQLRLTHLIANTCFSIIKKVYEQTEGIFPVVLVQCQIVDK